MRAHQCGAGANFTNVVGENSPMMVNGSPVKGRGPWFASCKMTDLEIPVGIGCVATICLMTVRWRPWAYPRVPTVHATGICQQSRARQNQQHPRPDLRTRIRRGVTRTGPGAQAPLKRVNDGRKKNVIVLLESGPKCLNVSDNALVTTKPIGPGAQVPLHRS